MSDYQYRTFPHLNIAVPSESPFFPIISKKITDDKEEFKAKFNQGYVFDYQSRDETNKTIFKIKIGSMDQEFDVTEGANFYVRVETYADQAEVLDGVFEMKKLGEDGGMDEDFHYNAKNLDDDTKEIYDTGLGTFIIPVCKISKDGIIEEIYLRDNIHWQKTGFENFPKEDPKDETLDEPYGILQNWGEEDEFKGSPNVKFKRVVTRTLEYNAEDPELIIQIEKKGKHILFKNQFPPVPKDKISILQRNAGEAAAAEWEWCTTEDPKKEYILVAGHSGGEKRAIWFEIPEEGGILRGKPRYGKGSGEIDVFPYPEPSGEGPNGGYGENKATVLGFDFGTNDLAWVVVEI